MRSAGPFHPFFAQQGFLLLDGGLATSLEARGHDLNDPLWSARVLLDAPAAVRGVHAEFLAAGADCIATVTYQATPEGFRVRGLDEEEAREAFRAAVHLATEARDRFWAEQGGRSDRLRPLVAASIGPYGAYLADGSEYSGRYGLTVEELVDFHRPRWQLLATAGADVIACETVPSLDEAWALLLLLRETEGAHAWVSFQCADPEHLADGTPLVEAVRACGSAPGLDAVGVNCVPPLWVSGLLSRAGRATNLPLVAYPNSGEVYMAATKSWRPGEAFPDLAVMAPVWRARGARLLGGCCRTGPDTIRRMRRALLAAS